MSKSKVILNERINLNDNTVSMPDFPNSIKQNRGIWRKTEVLCSNGEVINNPNGKSSFAPGCPFTKSKNMVPIGGVQYLMEVLFGVKGSQFEIPTLYEQTGIGIANSLPPTETFNTPESELSTDKVVPATSVLYRYGHLVQLFGIGITGTAENDVTVYPVDYRENSINISKVSTDNLTLTGTMIPFRYTTEELNSLDRMMYFGKKTDEEQFTSYYLKRFESEPVIKHIWKTGETYTEIEDETLVSSSDVWDNSVTSNTIESFTEIVLKISKKDVKEWFASINQSDRARMNTIALFTGRYVKDEDDASDFGEYQDVRLFSKLNIPVEYLNMTKDLNIIYRVYGA